jgi:hypothetical protein
VTNTYIFRAGLEWNIQYFDNVNRPKFVTQLPIELGPFHLALSPNALYYAAQMGWFQNHDFSSLDEPPPHQDYPNAIIYVETKIETKEGSEENVEEKADEIYEQLEAMLRLFSPGDIFLRRNISVGMPLKGGEFVWGAFIDYRSIRPKPEPLYQRDPYRLSHETLHQFSEFFYQFWDVVYQKCQPIYSALYRFSSSYERRTLTDRLIELMIAMETLFGDREYQRYKIPLRCACMLYSPGPARKQIFTTIRDFYDERSAILHGGKPELQRNIGSKVDQFESCVRESIVKFLELHKGGYTIRTGADLDDLLFLEPK